MEFSAGVDAMKGFDILFAKCFLWGFQVGRCDEIMKQDWICKPGRPRTQCPPCSTKKIGLDRLVSSFYKILQRYRNASKL